jgi:ferrochelatase
LGNTSWFHRGSSCISTFCYYYHHHYP